MMPGDHGGLGGGGYFNEGAYRHRGAAELGESNAAHGTIQSISGTTFILTTKQGELIVTTSVDTNYHSPRQAKEAGYEDLTFATLRVGQRVAVQGERQDDTTLFAKRVHIPKP
jgi:uncharacterized protein DUF5666